ncbi:hypothetical protein [Deminuibacter soli]|uniref:Uncharacterized protein n=1 Tax=Deminuibacter soli TaxID=2291815 RepID=A0A3E1NEP4_9BACT|nr:hypothetical protein [Deminuibacter soli]RFM26271.1 hypothetical protein DXN05_20385 [Deminuibacter soli]
MINSYATNNNAISNPTYYQNIRPMFSQYDMVMMGNYFNLHNYEEVKKWANSIYLALQPNDDPNMAMVGWSKLPQVHIMPEVPGKWPDGWIQTFKNWIDTGCPEGQRPDKPEDAVDSRKMAAFIQISQGLTGLPLDITQPNVYPLAVVYFNRLLERPNNQNNGNDTLLQLINDWNTNPTPAHLAQLVKSYSICSDIILIWYNSTTNWNRTLDGFGKGAPVPVPWYGTPASNQYKEALVWKVTLCHPMAWAPEITPFYWEMKPTDDGQYTGLYNKFY